MSEFIAYRFHVYLYLREGDDSLLCRGAFSEVTGLEASMAPKTWKEGGRNWGEVQLAGPATFPPIVLKRGITELADLWNWFDATTRQANYGLRCRGRIEVIDPDQPDRPALVWTLTNAMATKFKGPDLSSTANQVAVEELQLVHEGLELSRPS